MVYDIVSKIVRCQVMTVSDLKKTEGNRLNSCQTSQNGHYPRYSMQNKVE